MKDIVGNIGGYPTLETIQRIHNEQMFSRAVEAYRFFYPTVSMEGIWHGQRELGVEDNTAFLICASGPRQLIFTANSDTPYGATVLDLKQSGPMVIDLPSGSYIGLVDDHHQRWIADLGIPGPDEGKGGKYLILPPDHTGEIPMGYHTARSATYKVFIAMRAIPRHNDFQGALESLRNINIYPLDQAGQPSTYQFIDGTEQKADCTCLRWEDNLKYWEILHTIIDAEPILDEFRPLYGMLALLGIEKGKPFVPDAPMQTLLERAARMGRDAMIVEAFASSRPDRIVWNDRQWEWVGLQPENADFETSSALDIQARERWFIQAIVASPAMFRRTAGSGSLYWLAARDQHGTFLDGGKNYQLTIPQPIPANLFWSVTIYDAQTRSQIQTDQDKAALRSLFETFTPDSAGSIQLYTGPSMPENLQSQWIKTKPNRGWFAYFRIYGPQHAAFDGSWKPGDFIEIKR